MDSKQIKAEIKRIKDHFGFTLVKLAGLAEMNVITFTNYYKDYGRGKFNERQLLRLKINLHKLITNFDINANRSN